MIPEAVKGFLLGLSTGVLCLTHCAVILLPTLAVTREGTVKTSLLRLGEFSLGRALAYLVTGFLLGWAGALASPESAGRFFGLLYIPLGALLLLHVLRESDSPGWICRLLEPRRRFIRTPFFLGVLSGLAPCAPFGIAMVAVLEGGSGPPATRALRGLFFFGAFFLGTTLFLLPLASAGIAARFTPVRRLAKVVAGAGALFFLFSGLSLFLHPKMTSTPAEPLAMEEGDLRYVFREADAFSSVMEDGSFPYYWALRKGKVSSSGDREVETTTKLGVCFVTTEVVPGTKGWAGGIPVLVGLSSEGEIRGIRVLPGANRETPGFIDPLYEDAFQEKYRGLTVTSPVEAGVDVDGVTGATLSVEAVNEGVRNAAREAARALLGLDPSTPAASRSWIPVKAGPYILLVLSALAVTGYLAVAGAPFRTAVQIVSILLLGAWTGFYLTGADLSRALTLDMPPGSAGVAWLILMTVPLLLALVYGKLYCAWSCPFGTLAELLYRVIPVKLALSERGDALLRRARLIFLVGLPAVVVIADDPGVLRFEPLSSLFHPRSLTLAGVALLCLAVIGSILVERFYCKFLCPAGALFDLFASGRLLGRKPGVVCGGCYRAEKGCRFLREQGDDFKARRDRMRGDCIC